jgi:modification methylase
VTKHYLFEDDCRDLGFIEAQSVHLILTHPPGLGACVEAPAVGQLSAVGDYDLYLAELDRVWDECERVLVPGGRIACVVSPIAPDPVELPLGADILVRLCRLGFQAEASIKWVESESLEREDSEFAGQPNQPCSRLTIRSSDILVFSKPGHRALSDEVRRKSRMSADVFATCSSPVWLIPADGAPAHPQSFPLELADRLVRMYSYAGDTVLDPFAGAGTANLAAITHGRNSIGVEIEPSHFASLEVRVGVMHNAEDEIVVRRATAKGAAIA